MKTFLNRTKIMFFLMICLCFAMVISASSAASDNDIAIMDKNNSLEIDQSNDIEITLSEDNADNGANDVDDTNCDVNITDNSADCANDSDNNDESLSDANATVDYNQTILTREEYSNFLKSHGSCNHQVFNELNQLISELKPGDTLNLEKDYFSLMSYSREQFPIVISVDNITINGNGHIIDGKGLHTFITITGNNVKLNNMTIINSETVKNVKYVPHSSHIDDNNPSKIGYLEGYNLNPAKIVYVEKPINWIGDNGSVSNCTFYTVKQNH